MHTIAAVLLSACVCLSGFGGALELEPFTPAEQYLTETSTDEIFQHFLKATDCRSGDVWGFFSTEEIPTTDLYRFAVLVDGFVDTRDADRGEYVIPVERIREVLDSYFSSYQFDPWVFTPEGGGTQVKYDSRTDCLYTSSLGYGTGSSNPRFVSARALGAELVEVRMRDEGDPEAGLVYDITVAGEVTEQGVRFLRCVIVQDKPGGTEPG